MSDKEILPSVLQYLESSGLKKSAEALRVSQRGRHCARVHREHLD